MIRDCPQAVDYINRGLCKRDLANNWIVLPNNVWIPRWTVGNNIKERLDDYYRQNPIPATTGPSAPAPRTTIIAPTITSAVKTTATSDTSSPQYCYSTPIEDPAIVLKVVNRTLDIPISITQ
jgi:hypothetical protein